MRFLPSISGAVGAGILLAGLASLSAPARAHAAVAHATSPELGELSGTVTDTAGRPLAGVRVTVLEASRSAQTAADGRYRLPNLPNGTYGVSFALVGYAPVVARIAIPSRGATLDVELRPTRIELPEVQVTASPLATTALTSPQPTSVVAGAALDLAQAASLGETLEQVAGVRNFSTGAGIGKPVIRGLTGNRILVLADGQRTEGAQWGDEHGPNIETATAGRIEVIRGPASVLYGSDALGGVINVVERPLPDAIGGASFLHGRLNTAYATNGESPDGSLLLEGASGHVGFRGALSGRTSDDIDTPVGELLNSGNRAVGGQGAVGLRGGWGSANASYAYRDERLEIHEDPEEDPEATPFQRIGTHRAQVALNLPVRHARLQLDAGYERNRRREFEEAGADAAGDLALGLLSETWTGNAHFHHAPVGRIEGIVGASLLRTTVTTAGEETLVPASRSTGYGVYAFEQAELGPWHLSAGARYDYRTLDVDDTPALGVAAQRRDWHSLTGNVGALYRLSGTLAAVLNVGRGFRAPSPFDLFANGVHEGTRRYERGTATLRNETSLNGDLALRVQSDRVNAEVGAFLNLIDDYIYPDPTDAFDPESGLRIYDIVQGNARLAGFEAAAEYHATPWLHFQLTSDYTHGQNVTTGLPLPFIPAFRVLYSARIEGAGVGRIDDPYLQLGAESTARQGRLDPEDVATGGYTLVNLAAGFATSYGATDFAVDLSARNLLDRQYRSFLSRYKAYADDPGRSVVLRVSVAF